MPAIHPTTGKPPHTKGVAQKVAAAVKRAGTRADLKALRTTAKQCQGVAKTSHVRFFPVSFAKVQDVLLKQEKAELPLLMSLLKSRLEKYADKLGDQCPKDLREIIQELTKALKTYNKYEKTQTPEALSKINNLLWCAKVFEDKYLSTKKGKESYTLSIAKTVFLTPLKEKHLRQMCTDNPGLTESKKLAQYLKMSEEINGLQYQSAGDRKESLIKLLKQANALPLSERLVSYPRLYADVAGVILGA